MNETFEKFPTHNIAPETKYRNTSYRIETLRTISNYIYEQTGCNKCWRGKFCPRDGQFWGCLPYNNIAQHLNHIEWPSSRGNIGKWSTKTIRDQITKGIRKRTEREKQQFVDELNQQQNRKFVWDYHKITDGTQAILDTLDSEFGSIFIPVESDVDGLLQEIKETIIRYHETGRDVSVLVVRGKQVT